MRSVNTTIAFLVLAASGLPLCAQSSVVGELPFELSGHILMRVTIGGVAASLIYDPVNGIMLDRSFVRRSGIPERTGPEVGVGQARARGAGSAEHDVTFAERVALVAGSKHFDIPLAPIIPLDSMLGGSGGQRVDGLFGTSLLNEYVVEFDFSRSVLVLHDRRLFVRPTGYDSLGVTLHGERAAVPVWVRLTTADSVRGSFMLDFGMSGTLRFTTHFVDSLDLVRRTAATDSSVSETGLGGRLSSLRTQLSGFRLGSTTIERPTATLAREKTGADAHPPYDGLIGLGILRQLRMFYDATGRVLYVRRQATRSEFR